MYQLLNHNSKNSFNVALICNSPQCIDIDTSNTVQTRSKAGFGLGYLTEEPLNPFMSIHVPNKLIDKVHADYAKQLFQYHKSGASDKEVLLYITGYVAGLKMLSAHYLTKVGVELSKIDDSVYFYVESGDYQIHLDIPVKQPAGEPITGILSIFEYDEQLLTITGSLTMLSKELGEILPVSKHGMLLLPNNPYELSSSYFTETRV